VRTKRLRRYEAPSLVKREILPAVAAETWDSYPIMTDQQ
jgi:hypothetical protein